MSNHFNCDEGYAISLFDAFSLSREVAANVIDALEAQACIAAALKHQVNALSCEADALIGLREGSVDTFIARRNDAITAFTESIQHAAVWSAQAGAAPLCDSYQSAFDKFALRDKNFAARNHSGLSWLIAGIKAIVRISPEIIRQVSVTAQSTADVARRDVIKAADKAADDGVRGEVALANAKVFAARSIMNPAQRVGDNKASPVRRGERMDIANNRIYNQLQNAIARAAGLGCGFEEKHKLQIMKEGLDDFNRGMQKFTLDGDTLYRLRDYALRVSAHLSERGRRAYLRGGKGPEKCATAAICEVIDILKTPHRPKESPNNSPVAHSFTIRPVRLTF